MKNSVITITSDFGDQFACSQLRAVVASLGFEGQLIENHDVKPFSIIEGAYGIWQLAKFCPKETVHLGVVDPGVGSERAGVIIKTRNCWFVGPDNGLFWPGASRSGIEQVWRISESDFGEVANTFHGRDVFIKAAVWLTQSRRPEDFGCNLWDKEKLIKLEFQNGQILHIDNYGNVKFFWDKKVYPGEEVLGIGVVKTFSDVEEGKPLILNGSSDLLELAVNCRSAEEKFELKLEQIIQKL